MDWLTQSYVLWQDGSQHLTVYPWALGATLLIVVLGFWAMQPISKVEAEAIFDEGVMAHHTKQDVCPYRKGSKRSQLWHAGYAWHWQSWEG